MVTCRASTKCGNVLLDPFQSSDLILTRPRKTKEAENSPLSSSQRDGSRDMSVVRDRQAGNPPPGRNPDTGCFSVDSVAPVHTIE